MIRHPKQRVGVFIDTQNMYYSARSLFDRKVNFAQIVEDAVGEGQLVRAIAYVVSTKTAEETPFFEALQKAGIELREKQLMEYFSGQKKADWDVGLTVDAIRMIDMLDVVVIVSGDGDFLPLVKYVQSRGRIVQAMAFRETTSSRLVEEVDGYINLSADPGRYLIGPAPRATKRRTTTRKSAGAKPRTTKSSPETSTAPESPTTPAGFFESGANDDDQEEKRRNRLTF